MSANKLTSAMYRLAPLFDKWCLIRQEASRLGVDQWCPSEEYERATNDEDDVRNAILTELTELTKLEGSRGE